MPPLSRWDSLTKHEFTGFYSIARYTSSLSLLCGRTNDVTAKNQLLAAREEKVREYEGLTKELSSTNSSTLNEIRRKRDVVTQEMRKTYWRSMCDRIGLIRERGVLSFYPGERLNGANGDGGSPDEVCVSHRDAVSKRQGTYHHNVPDV